MKKILWLAAAFASSTIHAQSISGAAESFINLLDSTQRMKTLFPFVSEDRYNFHYFPINDRKGLPLEDMNDKQKNAAFALLNTTMAAQTVDKVEKIIELENLLKELENRGANDDFRDPGKYYLAIYGIPGDSTTWGWRFEGHHVSFNFSASDNRLISGTPGFLGSNPAVVQAGPKKGQEILKEERTLAFTLLHSFTSQQLGKAIIDSVAPAEIITGNKRKAMMEKQEGLTYAEMNSKQREGFLRLIRLYVYRYKKDFADQMLGEIQRSGLNKLTFAWAGHQRPGIGHPHYYRIQGPTVIIEYDNTQNNANHVHTVVRDLNRDFGGDAILEHYKSGHKH